MSLAENLRRHRALKTMSQASLAKAAGVSQQSISRIESGTDLTSKHLPKIARALGVPLHELDESFSGVAAGAPQEDATGRLVRLFADALSLPAAAQEQIADLIETRIQSASKSRATRTKQES